jgi:hypothetical protein
VQTQFEDPRNIAKGWYKIAHLALRVPRAPPPPVMTQRPGAASAAGPPAGGAATVTILPTVLAALSGRAAQPVHQRRRRRDGPCVKCNCVLVSAWHTLRTPDESQSQGCSARRVLPPLCIVHMQ